MTDDWRSDWSRHFDQIQWTSTTILTAGVGGLLVYCYSAFNSWFAFIGLWLTLLTVYYAASFRSTRRQIHEGMSNGSDEKAFLISRASLPQWPVFLLTFGVLTMAWLILCCQHGWRLRFWAALLAAIAVFILANQRGHLATANIPPTTLAKSARFDEEMMHVSLTDGRLISVPIIWFPLLHQATPEQRSKIEIGGGGASLHWPELDEDLSVAGLMAGADVHGT